MFITGLLGGTGLREKGQLGGGQPVLLAGPARSLHLLPFDEPAPGEALQGRVNRDGGHVAVEDTGADLIPGHPLRVGIMEAADDPRRAPGINPRRQLGDGHPEHDLRRPGAIRLDGQRCLNVGGGDLGGHVSEGVRGGEADDLRLGAGMQAGGAVAVRGEPQETRRVVLARLPGPLDPAIARVTDALRTAAAAAAVRIASSSSLAR